MGWNGGTHTGMSPEDIIRRELEGLEIVAGVFQQRLPTGRQGLPSVVAVKDRPTGHVYAIAALVEWTPTRYMISVMEEFTGPRRVPPGAAAILERLTSLDTIAAYHGWDSESLPVRWAADFRRRLGARAHAQ